MLSDQESARLGSQPRDRVALSRAEFVRALYRGYLNREPEPDEITRHASRLARGATEAQIIASLADCEEARRVAARRSAGTVSIENIARAQREKAPLTIRADDVVRVIAHTVARATGREPPFGEVAKKFNEFQRGADLATILGEIPPATRELEEREVVDRIVRLLFAGTLHRAASQKDLESWYDYYKHEGRLSSLVMQIADSEEARKFTKPDVSPGLLIQIAFNIILNRCATAHELDQWRQGLEQGTHTISGAVLRFFLERTDTLLKLSKGEFKNNPSLAYLFGSRGVVDAKEWDVPPDPGRRKLRQDVLGSGSMFAVDKSSNPIVSIVTSLYNGGEYIRSFLKNITSQSIFRDHCELIIIDACSPQNEGEVVAEFQQNFPNIVYRRCETKIGIYEAWNMGVRLASGRYCTNANLDDCRRADSLEIQGAILDSLPFVDVTYQDVLYSFEANIPFEVIEAHDIRTALPIISRYNLMEFNSPHNAPMWRTSLHNDVGYFNETLKSAGDYEFWMRCLIRGKMFFKSNAAHVGYYVNPEGLSTRPDTRGMEEAWEISRAHFPEIISPLLSLPHEEFIRAVEEVAPVPARAIRSGRRYDVTQAALCKLGSDSRIGATPGRAAARQGRAGSAKQRSSSAGGRRPGQRGEDTPTRLVIDGVCFQLNEPDVARLWASVLPALVAEPNLDIIVLDRGGLPDIAGMQRVPFPSYTPERYNPDDSALIQKICDLYVADVFTSTQYTTPLTTPMFLFIYDMVPELFHSSLERGGRDEKAIAIGYARRHISLSQNSNEDLLRFYPDLNHTSVAYPCHDDAVFKPRREKRIMAFRRSIGLELRPYVMTVGAGGPGEAYKGGRSLFDAIAAGRRDHLDVLCIGGGPTIDDQLLKLLPAGVAVKHILPTDDDLATAYSGAFALVDPSPYEGFGLPVIQAMACGCPVIITSAGVLPDVAGSAALLTDSASPAETLAALDRLGCANERATLRKAGVEQARKFDRSGMVAAVVDATRALATADADPAYPQFAKTWSTLRRMQSEVDADRFHQAGT